MEIDLRALQDGLNESDWEETPQELHIQDETLQFVGPIRTHLAFYKLGDSLSATGGTAFRLRLTCVRCLEPFEQDLETSFRFIFQQARTDEDRDDADEAIVWLSDKYGKVDLGEEVKDYILLEIPMNPLCMESCAGLCPTCGENLNLRKCTCKTEAVDPRWEALRKLKDDR